MRNRRAFAGVLYFLRSAAEALLEMGSDARAALPALRAALQVEDRELRHCVISVLRQLDRWGAATLGEDRIAST